MQSIYNTLNDKLKKIHNLMNNIKNNPNIENRNHLWDFCVNNEIDFLIT